MHKCKDMQSTCRDTKYCISITAVDIKCLTRITALQRHVDGALNTQQISQFFLFAVVLPLVPNKHKFNFSNMCIIKTNINYSISPELLEE